VPRPVGRGQRYIPGLDGLRAVAVGAVVLYHLGLTWLPGGLLGVGIFFTLSGYLITDLLLGTWDAGGRLPLADFWLRRARRLLPALAVLLVVVVVWVALGDPAELASVRAAAVSGLLYVNNWWAISHHLSYFARFGPPSPLGNLWSLSVEEQFYLLWPWVLLSVVLLVAGRRGIGALHPAGRERARRTLAVLVLVVTAASAVEMAVLYQPTFDPTRVYDGTDTRAFGLLVGAALAFVWPSRERRPASRRGTLALDAAGTVGLAVIGVLLWRTDQYAAFTYRGGIALLSLATALVVLSVTHPSSHVGRLLGAAPLRWLGVVSYGVYLWHYPIIVLTTPAVTPGGTGRIVRDVAQVAATLGVATASWHLVESPVRRGALGRLWRAVRTRRAAGAPHRRTRIGAGTGVVVATGVGSLAFAGVLPSAPVGTLAASGPRGVDVGHVLPSSRVIDTGGDAATPLRATGSHGRHHRDAGRGAGRLTGANGGGAAAPEAPSTSCTSVVHVGDSTSESLVSSTYLPPAEQLPAQYARVGVQRVTLEISGARSLVETLPGQVNGTDVVRQLVDQGDHGCWVMALGTNDAADIAVGSPVLAKTRIDTVMGLLHGQPVLWVEAVSELGSGPYTESNMASWDEALVQACAAYPNLRVYDWPAVARPTWFVSDGVHYNSAGSAARAAGIADALAAAFPRSPGRTGSPTGPGSANRARSRGRPPVGGPHGPAVRSARDHRRPGTCVVH
jgi:peptidoglycan/LPS O-acetylase OafA/YrhL